MIMIMIMVMMWDLYQPNNCNNCNNDDNDNDFLSSGIYKWYQVGFIK